MTPQELKEKLQGMKLPETHKMSAWENITNVEGFLKSHFFSIEQSGDKYEKTPAWERLLRFYESLGTQESKG